jgi:hypothetical protein
MGGAPDWWWGPGSAWSGRKVESPRRATGTGMREAWASHHCSSAIEDIYIRLNPPNPDTYSVSPGQAGEEEWLSRAELSQRTPFRSRLQWLVIGPRKRHTDGLPRR